MLAANKIFKKGSFLFRENDPSKDMYLLQSGSVRVSRKNGLKDVTICELSKGAVFGEMAMIDGRPRSASVQAVEESEVSVISPDDFSKRTQGVPPWFLTIIRMIIQRLRDSDKRLQSTVSQNNLGNVATALALVYSRHKEKTADIESVDLKFAKKELINILSIPLAELNTHLENLASCHLLRIDKNRIFISEADKLSRYSKYLRIRSTLKEDKAVNLSEDARAFLLFISPLLEKAGQKNEKGIALRLQPLSGDLDPIFGKSAGAIFDELTERGFFTVSREGEGKKSDPPGPFWKDKIITVNPSALSEFILVEEFDGAAQKPAPAGEIPTPEVTQA